MLSSKHIRPKNKGDKLVAPFIDTANEEWLEVAGRLVEVFADAGGRTRDQLAAEVREVLGDVPGQIVQEGLVKLLEDRCDFEVQSPRPPAEVREAAFRASAAARKAGAFDRTAVLRVAAAELGCDPATAERALFADLKSEQTLANYDATDAKRLLERYNVAVAQAILLRAGAVEVTIRHEKPARLRHLFRVLKFHRLIWHVEKLTEASYKVRLDGPLSLFSATQRYGVQLALFLPHLLRCADFELRAEVRWGQDRAKERTFVLRPTHGLVSHVPDAGNYVPDDLQTFVELFARKATEWELHEEADLFPLGGGVWIPDFRLKHKATGKEVCLEILGFWRKAGVEAHLARLKREVKVPFLLAISDQLHVGDDDLAGLPGAVYRFRATPLPDEVARLASELVGKE